MRRSGSPRSSLPRLAALGLFGATIEGYGCPGLGHTAYGLICEELERGDSSVRSCVSVQSSLVMGAIFAFGSDEQRTRWLPDLARGEKLGCFALTEVTRRLGSRAHAHACTTPRRRLDRSTARSIWITNGALADVAVVWARPTTGSRRSSIEKGTRGFESRVIKNKLSLRASSTAELVFADVTSPRRARLPEANGIKAALRCLDDARFGIAWGACGAARGCIETVLAYTQSRELFGRPLNQTQLIQTRLANAVRQLARLRN